MRNFSTKSLVEVASLVSVIDDNCHYEIDHFERHDSEENWELRVHKDAPPDQIWFIPDQHVAVANTGLCAVIDGLGHEIFLAFKRAVPLTTTDFEQLIEAQRANEQVSTEKLELRPAVTAPVKQAEFYDEPLALRPAETLRPGEMTDYERNLVRLQVVREDNP